MSMIKKVFSVFVFVVAVSLVFVACEGPTTEKIVTVDGVERISITKPNKTGYSQDGSFSSAGLVVVAHYTDGSAVTVNEGYTLYWQNIAITDGNTAITGQVGDKTITVDWRGKTATFTVTVSNDNNITVTTTDQWNNALSLIRDGGNTQEYTLTITGDVGVPGSTAASTSFGSVTGLGVTLTGTGKLHLTGRGSILRLGNNQTLYIDGPTLEGLTTGANGATQNNDNPVVYITGATAKLELRSGTISGNTNSSNGGGVYVTTGGSFIMTGGSISGNTFTGGNYSGGGVYVSGSNSNFTMSGGTVSGNISDYNGGGVSVDNYGSFTMSAGTISGNSITSNSFGNLGTIGGGGVHVNTNGNFTMAGGTISGNAVNGTYTNGGGVYVNYDGSFSKSGGGVIYGNNAPNEADKNTAPSNNWGQAVYYYASYSPTVIYYRDTTLDTGDGISTAGTLPANSGDELNNWTKR